MRLPGEQPSRGRFYQNVCDLLAKYIFGRAFFPGPSPMFGPRCHSRALGPKVASLVGCFFFGVLGPFHAKKHRTLLMTRASETSLDENGRLCRHTCFHICDLLAKDICRRVPFSGSSRSLDRDVTFVPSDTKKRVWEEFGPFHARKKQRSSFA